MGAILNEFGQPYTFAHAADRSSRRGPQFTVRNEDIDRLIPSNDRRTIASLSNRLFTNMGVPKACVLQKADYSVGEAWLPSYIGTDREAGKPIAKFMTDVWLPQCDTRGGIFDWWKLLELTSVAIDRDGDIFWLLVKGADNFPRIQMIPGHRCYQTTSSPTVEDAGNPFKGYRISDGVIYYASGRPAAYRFNLGKDGKEAFQDIPAADVIHLFDPTHCEQGRGLPAFTHALESLKMSLFSTEDERIRQQIISRLHLTVMDELISEMGRIFGAQAAAEGTITGELTNFTENAADTLEIVIHSPGGSVLDGYTLYHEINALRARGVFVTATINSLAASMASVIAMACDEIRMVPQGRMMIHEVQQGVRGGADELAAAAQLCDSMSNEIADIYAAKTGKTSSEMRALMKKETWMNAKEALAAGFIDAVFDIRDSKPTKNEMNGILSKLFPGNDQVAQLEASIAENDSLRAALAAKDLKITELTGLSAIIADKDLEITALADEKLKLSNEITSLTTALAAKDAEIEAAKASAGTLATETLAAIGQPEPLKLDENASASTSHLDKFNSLKGREATAYYNEFQKEIAEEQRASRFK